MIKREYLLPNFITLLSLFSGFYSIIASINGNFVLAAYAIIFAFVFDGLDGKVARMLHATSEFGIQMDSLSDLVAFGLAPALLIYKWVLTPYGRVGWMASFLFVACGALRLARFNVMTKKIDNRYFIGLPIPAAAGVIASSVLFVKEVFGKPEGISIPLSFVLFIYLLAFLMVSNVKYYSFKKLELHGIKPFSLLVGFALFIFVIGMYPEIFLFVFFIGYTFSGLLLQLLKFLKYRALEVKEGRAD
ncbi:CDP-diacylglycerol--serine O-phosphatidyltransferase [Deferribacter autotrophicus]|uniref:CDP-diacylglycerol--serine O-phosphatidyltransferase n=1 Tax=Deferribacter autotrophicus TaxID=500465 RepID=A0A5A8F5L2_9BACT|nr:CDP-diacylglycerol--serine O-phosphatidyltransferase [Deferribacter autotrophicus]KAA0258004.1 CDP-diacylglycerol--serine O-phosphatidyltransferase [Deferribacter autotrophicus]